MILALFLLRRDLWERIEAVVSDRRTMEPCFRWDFKITAMEHFISKNLWHQQRIDIAGASGNISFLFFGSGVGESLFKIG